MNGWIDEQEAGIRFIKSGLFYGAQRYWRWSNV